MAARWLVVVALAGCSGTETNVEVPEVDVEPQVVATNEPAPLPARPYAELEGAPIMAMRLIEAPIIPGIDPALLQATIDQLTQAGVLPPGMLPPGGMFRRWMVLEQTPVADAAQRDAIVAVLRDQASYADASSDCFEPEAAFSVRPADKPVHDVVVSFACQRIERFVGDAEPERDGLHEAAAASLRDIHQQIFKTAN